MIERIRELLELIATGATDRGTIDELLEIIGDELRWKEAHALFGRIRTKTLQAGAVGNHGLGAQYSFEEICAKCIYNESYESAPFDLDSPFWVVPLAMHAAQLLGIEQGRVLEIVTK